MAYIISYHSAESDTVYRTKWIYQTIAGARKAAGRLFRLHPDVDEIEIAETDGNTVIVREHLTRQEKTR